MISKPQISLLLILIQFAHSQKLDKSRSVWVEQGLVRGKIYKIGDRPLQIFRGIPYAEAPIGELRFQRAVKKGRWHQELAAVEYGPPCLQFMDFHRNDRFASENMKKESEDCLYLNVFSPYDAEDESSLSPILVWIHGGSFLAGSGDTGIDMETVAKNIVFKGVTLITLNYRLGPLGFMNFNNDGKVEGNYGIWDIVTALEWIQANMKQLNGDPTRVTLMGESAGAAAVSLLAVSPVAKDLFHRAIIMSGSSAAGWAVHTHGTPQWNIENIVSYLRQDLCERVINEEDASEIVGDEYSAEEIERKHCNYQDEKIACLTPDLTTPQMVSCLRKHLNFSSPLFRRALATELGVSKIVVDGQLITSAGAEFIRENARIPILTGVAKSEWSHKKPQFYNLPCLTNLSKEEVEQAVFRVIDVSFHNSEKLSNATLLLLSNASFVRYLDDPNGTFTTASVVSALQRMEADIEFVAPCHREIAAYQSKGVPVYAYSFDFLPNSSIYEEEKKIFSLFGRQPVDVVRKDGSYPDHRLEAFHGLDHAYIFTQGYTSNFEIKPFSKRDEIMSKMVTNMWTNFVKTGDPSTARFKWEPSTENETHYVSIDLPPRVIRGDIHWPAPKYWNVEAELISKFVPKGSDRLAVDPASELTNEERVELGAYRRAWWALWVLVAVIAVLLWALVLYIVIKKSRAPRSKPYDNIVVAPR